MKILIVGAGIIGSSYGWAFAEAGNDVTHLVRPGKAAAFKDGIKIDMYDTRKAHKKDFIGRYTICVTETLHPSDGYELVIAEEVQVFFYDLLNTGKELGVAMPVMSSFEPDIQRFAGKEAQRREETPWTS